MPEIRNALPQDIPLIRKLALEIWPQTYAPILSPEQIEYMLNLMYSEEALYHQMINQACTFILVYDKGTSIGFASFSETEKGLAKLHKIYIHPGQQGKGTGRFVLGYIIAQLQSQQIHSLQLQVNRFNKAKDFYERLGFTVIQEADFDIGNGYFMNDYVMEKKI